MKAPTTLTIADKIKAINDANDNKTRDRDKAKGADQELNTWIKFYSVQFNRRSFKKYAEKRDGFVAVGSQYSVLVDDESRFISKGGSNKLKELEIGEKFAMTFFVGELLEEMDVHEYESGTCFLNL